MKRLFPFLSLLILGPAIMHGQVLLSEIATENTKYEDEDTDEPDWFELYNTSDSAVDLEGWLVTTSEAAATAWTIRDLVLEPNTVQLIFASGKNRQGAAAAFRPHADFVLENSGGYLALLEPDQTVAHALTYPALGKNVSFGVRSGKEGYFFPATPNEVNNTSPSAMGLTPGVQFSHQGGLINGSVELVMEVPNHPEAKIRYSLDGQTPSLFTPSYTGPITISKTQIITAQATLPGHLSSRLKTRGFVVMDDSMTSFAETGQAFESNLPVIVIDSQGQNLNNGRDFKSCFVSVTSPDGETKRTTLGTTEQEYAGPCGVHLRGESSAGFGQKSYALEIQDEDGDDNDVSLLGMPADSDWALYGPWSEKSLMRNKLIFDWMRKLRGADGTSMRAEFCELFIQSGDGDALGYDAYQGIYLLMEKIKRGRNRVPIENLNFDTTDPNKITGGYIIRKDKDDSGKNNWSTTVRNITRLQSFDPDRFNPQQLDYIKGYLNSFEQALVSDSFDHPTKGYRKYIDVGTFIDAQLFVELTRQVDGYVFSTYWHKDRNGKLRAGPLWDFNISLGNADYATGDRTDGWLYDNRNGHGQIWYPDLHKDPEYHLAHWDRYWHMRHSFLSDEAVLATIDGHVETLLDGYTEPVGNREPDSVQNPVARHFRKYPFLGTRQWPNPSASTRVDAWQDEIDYLKEWFLDRLDWMDDQSIVFDNKIYRAPNLSTPPGALASATEIEIIPHKGGLFDRDKYPQETIYYTTDGSDPRIRGGELNPVAKAYEGPILVDSTMTIQTRLRDGNTWSPRASRTYLLDHEVASFENVIVSEIMYHPTDPAPLEEFSGFKTSSVFEYLELTNTSASTIDLSGAKFSRGIQFDFNTLSPHERLLAPLESVLLVKNREGFAHRHGDIDEALILGQYTGKLSNDGERVTLENSAGEDIVDVNYNDGESWPAEADGQGHSLVWANIADAQDASAWKLSAAEGGSPGTHTIDGSSATTPSASKDSDNDGLNDLVESLLGSDPNDSDSGYHPQIEVVSSTSYRLHQQHIASVANDLGVEQSTDLITWTTLDLGPPETSVEGDTARSTWELTSEEDSPGFLRIRIAR
ncbi:CotH kinase family protein [Verrucomicrobiales bacterium]|jgi:hypothetical protein|nr:CotH kinase family protein [Verrucomicrobiales bacterium]